jgi:hypothetical protein
MAGAFGTWLPVGYSPEKNGPDRYINEGRAWRAQLLREILINRSSIHFAPPDGSPRRCSVRDSLADDIPRKPGRPHSAHGFSSGTVGKKIGLAVTSPHGRGQRTQLRREGVKGVTPSPRSTTDWPDVFRAMSTGAVGPFRDSRTPRAWRVYRYIAATGGGCNRHIGGRFP